MIFVVGVFLIGTHKFTNSHKQKGPPFWKKDNSFSNNYNLYNFWNGTYSLHLILKMVAIDETMDK